MVLDSEDELPRLSFCSFDCPVCQMALQCGHIALIETFMTFNNIKEPNLMNIQEILGIEKAQGMCSMLKLSTLTSSFERS